MSVTLSNDEDTFKWKLTPNGVFSVKSMHIDCMNGHTPFLRKYLWKLKVPLKIKIFMWFLNRKVIITKYNLAKRIWNGCKKCTFRQHDETLEHLFISCSFVRDI